MRKAASALLVLVLASAVHAAEVPVPPAAVAKGEDGTWLTSHARAEVLARVRRRPMLALFTGSDWCGWCKRLQREALALPEFRDYAAANLVLLEVDFPRRKPQPDIDRKLNRRLLDKHGVTGFPTLVLFDPRGTEIGRLGYTPGGASALIGKVRALIETHGAR